MTDLAEYLCHSATMLKDTRKRTTITGKKLPDRYRDHTLKGNYSVFSSQK